MMMKPHTHRLRIGTALVALVALIALTLVTTAVVHADYGISAPVSPLPPDTGSRIGPAGPGGMMGHGSMGMMGGMMGNTSPDAPYDRQFLDEMIPHHAMAIAMVQIMISQSDHPELRDLGGRIITGQQQQIDQMEAWRQQWYPDAPPLTDMMGGMMGNGGMSMMGGGMMTGGRADRMFLRMMVPHHQRAIDLSEDALTNGQHPELTGLATDIIAVQSAEITEMKGYLRMWYGMTP